MTNQQWLKEQGLLSVKELWVNIYPPLVDPLPDYGSVGFVNRPSDLVLTLSKELRMQGLSRHSLGDSGCGSPVASKCGEGELKAPLYPIGWSSPARSPAENYIDARQHKFGL